MHARIRHPRLALLLALLAWLGQALPAHAASSTAVGGGSVAAHCAHLTSTHHAPVSPGPNAHDCCSHSACGCASNHALTGMASSVSRQQFAQRAAPARPVRLTLAQAALPWRPPSA